MEKEDRKAQIIELSFHLIQEKGYVAFSYDDLAKKLGVTKASIHYHFEKKEDLGLAVCDRLERNIKSTFYDLMILSPRFHERIRQYVKFKEERVKDKEICSITSLLSNIESLPPRLQERAKEVALTELKYVTRLFEEGKEQGELVAHLDVEAAAAIFLSCLKGALQYKRITNHDMLKRMFSHLYELIENVDKP